jgi:hypothetical protein
VDEGDVVVAGISLAKLRENDGQLQAEALPGGGMTISARLPKPAGAWQLLK